MADFRTQVPVKKYDFPMDYSSRIFSIGSCFADAVSDKFRYFKLQNKSNPFGVLFHPLAIEKVLEKSVKNIEFTESDLVYHNELWHCFDVHSEFSSTDKAQLLKRLNQELEATKQFLEQSTQIIITLGTSWVYRHIEKNKIVANCHKVPQREFRKELLSVDEISESLSGIVDYFPDKKIIFTISPVRHIKDGFFENNLSKSHLFSALQTVLNERISYFPSYEILMDELRDYRFFAEDMIHPNQIAIDYIWKRFSENYLTQEALEITKEIDSIQKALQHKAFNPQSQSHKDFLKNTQKRIEKLASIWF